MNDSLSLRVAARYSIAKSVKLLPTFVEAMKAFQGGDTKPLESFIRQIISIIVPDDSKHPPQWYYALGTAKRNTLNWLQKEGHVLLMDLPSVGQDLANPTAPGSRFNKFPEPEARANLWKDHFVKRLELWGKKLRTLEIAVQAEDEEKHIKHGPFTVVRMAGLTQADVDGALAALDAASDKIRDKFPQVLYGFVYLSTHLGTKRAASYVFNDDTIQLSVHARKRFSDMQTLIHEMGHRLEHKFLSSELREEFWKLSTEKVMETIHYDETLRGAVADEAIQMATARKNGTPMPTMSADLERWIKSPLGVGPYIKTVMTNFISGKVGEKEARGEIMGKQDRYVETGTVLHAPLHVTPYGGTHPRENFAEAFAFYVLGLPMPPELTEIIAKV